LTQVKAGAGVAEYLFSWQRSLSALNRPLSNKKGTTAMPENKTPRLLALPFLAFLLTAAHFLRWGESGATLACLLMAGLLFWQRGWVPLVVRILLMGAALLWAMTAADLVGIRIAAGLDWLRTALILGGVTIFTLGASLSMGRQQIRCWYDRGRGAHAPAAAFLLTSLTLALLQGLDFPLLLAERFLPGHGWTQVLLMGTYAAWITEQFLDPGRSALWRLRIWSLFSLAFFGQLALGLAGVEEMLMSGSLHLPVPALILAGPLYRGADFFMPFLFLATLVLVGPAWCSHLCYIGAWEGLCSSRQSLPHRLPAWRQPVRIGLLFLVAASAIGLRLLAAPWWLALSLAALFGLVGVGIMVLVSRRNGVMSHCVGYCPMGLLANWLGRISPFRLKIAEGCKNCLLCARVCRYDALGPEEIRNRRPGPSCTLCGDCLGSCPKGLIRYSLPLTSAATARAVFLVLVLSLHAVFLAVARI
jgi:NAD-dependent dihydropyrimidine dehydrogenase PreA subunit